MRWLGNLTEDQIIDFKFYTHKSDGTPFTLAGTPVLSVYKANGITESTVGITLSVDFDGRTGLNHVRIDTSANIFYETGEDYEVVITAGTVDGISVVGYVVGSFSIENRFDEVDVAKWSGNTVTGDGDWSKLQTDVDAVKAVTDSLPNGGALTDIDTGINNIEDKLPTKSTIAGTNNADGDIEMNESTGDFNTTQQGRINTEVDNALNTAIPGSPTADSINERIKALDELTEAGGAGDLASIKSTVESIVSDILESELSELSSVPDASPKLKEAIMLLYMALRNRTEQTSTKQTLFKDGAGSPSDAFAERDVSDNGTIFVADQLEST